MTETTVITDAPVKTPFFKNPRLIKTAAIVTIVTVAVLVVGSKLSNNESDETDSDATSD